MAELTPEQIAAWLGWSLLSDEKVAALSLPESETWYRSAPNTLQPLRDWLDPDSNDWVELLEALRPNYYINFGYVRLDGKPLPRITIFPFDSTTAVGEGQGETWREAFLAALAQLIEKGE